MEQATNFNGRPPWWAGRFYTGAHRPILSVRNGAHQTGDAVAPDVGKEDEHDKKQIARDDRATTGKAG